MSKTPDKRTDGLRTARTTLKREPKRGSHDFETISQILDEALYCHVGFAVDSQPFVIPAVYGRDGRNLYLHGSAAGRTPQALSEGTPICVTVTLFDGLVLGRSGYHHSVNYRSAMIFGVAHKVAADEKLRALQIITEHMVRGRWADLRAPTSQELKATTVLKLGIEEASAKIRQGPPLDDEPDYALPCWAGEIPFALVPQTAVPDKRLPSEIELPTYVAEYSRP